MNPKRAKDLLYLRDLMASGEEIGARIAADIREIARSNGSGTEEIRAARNNLGLALNGTLQRILPEPAEAVSVRLGVSPEKALADVRGHLTDFALIVQEVLDA